MIICRTAEQCGQADYGWPQARYTFSFGHYFDPELLLCLTARVEPGSAQARLCVSATYLPAGRYFKYSACKVKLNIATATGVISAQKRATFCYWPRSLR